MSKWKATRQAHSLAVLLLGLLGLVGGCGNIADASKSRVRLVNATLDYTQLDFVVNGSLRRTAVAYGVDPGSVDIAPGEAATELRRSGSSSAVLSFTPSLSKDKDYILLAYGKEGSLKTVLLDENNSKPDSGKTKLRVINAAPDAGAVDIYVTTIEQPAADAVALQTSVVVGTLGSFVSVDSGTRRLRVTAAGSRSDVRLDISNLTLASQQVATLVITPGKGGVLVQALLLTERGAVTRADNSQARVRAVAGVAQNGSVSASMAGTPLLTAVGSPQFGTYTLVAAGAAVPVVTVGSVGISSHSKALEAGADYTMLVYGPPNAALVAWINDDNRQPADTSKARVRLVNGVSGLSQALALSVNLTQLAAGVLPGTASAYATLDASTTASLSVNAADGSTPLYSDVNQTFSAGSSYTLFVLGVAPSPRGILRKDR